MARDYTDLITSRHRNNPKFVATVQLTCVPYGQIADLGNTMYQFFDLDAAVGVQLDQIGLWVGITREVAILSTDYFSFDTQLEGFDQGVWFKVGDSLALLSALSDEDYRFLLRAKIACNRWDGSLPSAYRILVDLLGESAKSVVFRSSVGSVLITITGELTVITQALLSQGYVPLSPAGITVNYRFLNPS